MVSCQMDRGPSLFSLCGLIYCVFQTAPFSTGDESACPCPKIPPVNLTEAPPTDCFQIDAKFRYECKAGYVRKAGRSNRITCILKGHRAEWTQPDLLCIRDPKIGPTTKPTNPPLISDHTEFLNVSITSTTVNESACPCPKIPPVNLTEAPPTDCFQIDAKFRYECKAGYVKKAGRSNLIRCILKGHRAEWTQPNLLCIRDPKIGPTTKPTNPPLISDHTEFLNVSITSTTVTKTASVDPTWTSPTTSDPLPAGTSGFAIGGTNAPQGGKNNPPDFASQPKYIVSLCVGLVCVVALVGGLIYIFFFKSRASPAEQPLPAEQIPLGKRPIGVDGSPRFFN